MMILVQLALVSIGKSRLRRFCGCALRFRPAKGVTFAGLRCTSTAATARVPLEYQQAGCHAKI
jgi:hypothetical protein